MNESCQAMLAAYALNILFFRILDFIESKTEKPVKILRILLALICLFAL